MRRSISRVTVDQDIGSALVTADRREKRGTHSVYRLLTMDWQRQGFCNIVGGQASGLGWHRCLLRGRFQLPPTAFRVSYYHNDTGNRPLPYLPHASSED